MTRSDKGTLRYSDAELISRHSVQATSGCWLWTGDANKWGYGRVGKNREERLAHRLSFSAFKGPIPDGIKVLHTCDTPACVNPEHLFLGTLSDNIQDAISKGRHVALSGERNPRAKLDAAAVAVIRANPDRLTISELARKFNVSRRAIAFAAKGETWAAR